MTVFTSTLTAIAQLLTIYKVIYRHVMRRFKWEDACTVVALIGSVICVVTSWTQFELAGKPSVISLWIYALTYPSVVWSVRLSILLSLLHLTLPSLNLRRAMLFIAALFVLTWLSLTMTFVGNLASSHHWYSTPNQQDRKWARSVAIFELIADILSDGTLITLAIHSLRSVKLPHSRQRLFIAAFSTNILVTIVSSFRAACQVLYISTFIGVTIEIEVACSLFVCNSLFVTTLVYRMLHRNDTANAHSPSMRSVRAPGDTLQFTSVRYRRQYFSSSVHHDFTHYTYGDIMP
ncbi:hypothetical protein V8E55_011459 [Tylopilus felleus]